MGKDKKIFCSMVLNYLVGRDVISGAEAFRTMEFIEKKDEFE